MPLWYQIILLVIMGWVIAAAFIFPAPQQAIGEASRIFYFHVPQAWVTVVAFLMSLVASLKYLGGRNLRDDDRARAAAGLGLMFCLLATVTGSIFARVTWHSFWNWDPRETSIFILLLIYGAYFALRSAVDDREKRARLAAAYAVFAFMAVPFLVFVIPRVMPSLHPADSIIDESGKITMSATTAAVFFPSLIAFTMVYLWIYRLTMRVFAAERKRREESA